MNFFRFWDSLQKLETKVGNTGQNVPISWVIFLEKRGFFCVMSWKSTAISPLNNHPAPEYLRKNCCREEAFRGLRVDVGPDGVFPQIEPHFAVWRPVQGRKIVDTPKTRESGVRVWSYSIFSPSAPFLPFRNLKKFEKKKLRTKKNQFALSRSGWKKCWIKVSLRFLTLFQIKTVSKSVRISNFAELGGSKLQFFKI